MKKILLTALALILMTVMLTATASAATLTVEEIMEQVAVPLATANDTDAGIQDTYTAKQLAELVDALNDNGFFLEENNIIMQLVQNGLGYYEEETIMEICRQAFGGNSSTWTLEQQDWFGRLMAEIGFYDTWESCLPGGDNMTCDEAEAFAFAALKQRYGKQADPENREKYRISRQFYREPENDDAYTWSFELEPLDIEYGTYYVSFEDRDPEGTVSCWADIPDWSGNYACDDVEIAFERVYGWYMTRWPQSVWQRFHEMMAATKLDPDHYMFTEYRGYQLTSYPEPAEDEISREEAIRIAKEALKLDRAALNSAVLTEYDGERAWLVGLIIYEPEDGSEDAEAGAYTVTVDSKSGEAVSVRKSTRDDDSSMAFVPEAAYEKVREGRLKSSDYIQLAAEAIRLEYPELDPLNADEFEARDQGGIRSRSIWFVTKNIQHGNASARVSPDGTVTDIEADTDPLDGDNLMERYWSVNGYFGSWDQEVWVRLGKDAEKLAAESTEGKLLQIGHFPEESSVRIGHEEAKALAIKASKKGTYEVHTCVLIDAEPHPVWKMRLLSYDPEDEVIELDAETGEVIAVDVFRTDYTPNYHLYSLEKNWRKLELETFGPIYMAKQAVTYAYGDLWLDFPELNVDDPDEYEIEEDGGTIRFNGRWAGMKSYTVELDENGYILRCEETDTESTKERPPVSESGRNQYGVPDGAVYGSRSDAEPREDGKPAVWGMDFAPAEYWAGLEEIMNRLGVDANNIQEKQAEWYWMYGEYMFWPQEYEIAGYMLTAGPDLFDTEHPQYPVMPSEGKKTEEEIQQIAVQYMHAEVDEVMGAEWADTLAVTDCLWNEGYLMNTGDYTGTPCWDVEFRMYEEEYESWSTQYYMVLSEDGEVLYAELTLDSNG